MNEIVRCSECSSVVGFIIKGKPAFYCKKCKKVFVASNINTDLKDGEYLKFDVYDKGYYKSDIGIIEFEDLENN